MTAELVPTIGLEVHMHLATRSKMFCGCRVAYDARPNSLVCPVCLGMPGVLPVMNKLAVELSVRMALALNCTIPDFAKWDRKHYYYPDLPKNYQISQYDQPLGINGYLDVETPAGTRRIGITRVHLEEDAGKLMHAEHGNYSIVDLNRTGTPLLEVVSEPDVRGAEEARLYAETLRQLAVYLGISYCNMQLGQMRCEPNVSLRIGAGPDGKPLYTPISELKNLNSFRSVERAVTFEIARHRQEYLADPGNYTLAKQGKSTRGWRDDEGISFLQRSKEEAHDYRYLPEPDLVPFVPERAWVEELRKNLPELPRARRERYIKMGLSEETADMLLAEAFVANFWDVFHETLEHHQGAGKWPIKRVLELANNWTLQDVRRALNEKTIDAPSLHAEFAKQLADLVVLVETGVINRNTGAEVFNKMIKAKLDLNPKSAAEIVKEENLAQTSDSSAIEAFVDQALAANAKAVEDYRGGKKASFGRLMGEAMKASGGKANPQLVKEILLKKLGG
jgi:aspartyl-tRNA(Asn)/glutamyl-tRNA(Gln) amidotransferase subunit B